MPRWAGSALGSVFMSTNTTPERSPFVTHIFWPLSSQSPSSVSLGGRLDALHVRAHLGLGEREGRPHLAGGHPRQEVLLLLVGAELHQQVGADEVGVDDPGDRDPAPRQLLHDHRVGGEVEPHPAVLLGDGHAEEPELLHLLDHGVREGVLVVVLLGHGEDLVVDELADHLGDGLLLVGLLGVGAGRDAMGRRLRGSLRAQQDSAGHRTRRASAAGATRATTQPACGLRRVAASTSGSGAAGPAGPHTQAGFAPCCPPRMEDHEPRASPRRHRPGGRPVAAARRAGSGSPAQPRRARRARRPRPARRSSACAAR